MDGILCGLLLRYTNSLDLIFELHIMVQLFTSSPSATHSAEVSLPKFKYQKAVGEIRL